MDDSYLNETNFSSKVKHRFIFLGEFIFALLFNFIFFIIIQTFIEMIDDIQEIQYIIIFWITFTIATSLGIIIAYKLITQFKSPSNSNQNRFGTLFLPFKITKSNFKEQLWYTAILFFIIYVPLDMLGYYIPNMLEFSAASLLHNIYNNYLTYSLQIMIPVSILVHFCVAFREEFLIRNYFLVLGEEELKPSTAYLYSAIYFGLAHFNYIFSPQASNFSPFFPIYWGTSAMIIGLSAGLVFLKKKMVWPLIISHWGNNVISAIAVRNHIAGISYSQTVSQFYLPLLLISLVVLIFSWDKIKNGFNSAINLLKGYPVENLPPEQDEKISKPSSKTDLTLPKPKESLSMFIITDIGILILLWFLSLFLV